MTGSGPLPVDWEVAALIGGRFVAPGPVAPRPELEDLVAGLREAADRSVAHVLDVTRMLPADGRDLAVRPLSTVHVVDRARWIGANTQVMEAMLGAPRLDRPREAGGAAGESAAAPQRVMTAADAVSHMAGGAQVGVALSLVASKVLGQLDPYASPSPGTGRLLLVAPNILAVQRSLKVNASHFHLWVCLHEQTHALQFAAAPWLAPHMTERTSALLDDIGATGRTMSVGTFADRGRAAARTVRNFVRGGSDVAILDRFLTPEQRLKMADLGAVMSLLEGHADVVMDEVGPSVVPSVRRIRQAFDARRQDVRARDFVVRKLLGMDAKMAQYRDGAIFVRAVLDAGGWDMLNLVWTGPQTLPTAREIAEPRAWMQRVAH